MPVDSYGKMRTCAYFPVQILSRDLDGNLIDQEYPDGFEDDFIQAINYKGTKNDEENLDYSLKIPELPTLDRAKISVRLDEMAKAIKNKVINEN